jgi:hypothetical protein
VALYPAFPTTTNGQTGILRAVGEILFPRAIRTVLPTFARIKL